MDRDVRSADDEALVADDAHADIVDDDDVEELPQSDPAEEARADEFERQVQAEAMEQFKRLKDDAQAIYGRRTSFGTSLGQRRSPPTL